MSWHKSNPMGVDTSGTEQHAAAGDALPLRKLQEMVDAIPSERAIFTASEQSHNDDRHTQTESSNVSVSNTASEKATRSSTREKPSPKTIFAFAALCMSIFLVALDTVLIPTALPTISSSFHIADSLYAWVGSAYLLANAGSTPFWGKLSDIFGRKPILLTSNTIFLIGSIICAVSLDAAMLVAGRAVQGLGGGGVVVLVHVCVSDMFAIRDRSFYMGTVGGVWALASALGPSLGGIFAEYLTWRWCFYINLPIVSISVITLYLTLHLPSTRINLLNGLASMDWLGAVTILSATSLLLVGLQHGGRTSYGSAAVIVLIVFGVSLFAIFPITQWWESKRGREPIMPLCIFKDISNLSALSVCACDALVFNALAYFLPLYFQIVLEKSPSMAGVYMLAIAIPLAVISFVSGYVIEKTGRYLEVLQAGLLLMTIGVGLLISLTISTSLAKTLVFLFIIGLGFGPNFGAPLIALQTRIQPCDIATGTSAFGFVRMISGAVGLVVGQVLFQGLMKAHRGEFAQAGISTDLVSRLSRGEALSSGNAISMLKLDQKEVVQHGLATALRGTWIFFTVVSALGLLVSFGIKRAKLQHLATEDDSPAMPPSTSHVRGDYAGGKV